MTRLARISMPPARRAFGAALVALALVAGCTQTLTLSQNKEDAAAQTRSARFEARPEMMFAAARSACSGPGERFVSPAPGIAQCHILMEPQTTAGVLLNFDGTMEDLPRLVISLSETKAAEGWVVTSCAFLRVPTKDGHLRRVVQSDPRIRAKLAELLGRMGGTPVETVAPEVAERCYRL